MAASRSFPIRRSLARVAVAGFAAAGVLAVGLAGALPSAAQTEPQVDLAAGADPQFRLVPPPGEPDWCADPQLYDDVVVETADGEFVVTRSDPTGALTVTYSVGGSAVPGQDYAPLAGSVTFADGETVAVIPVQILPFEVAPPHYPIGTVEVVLTDGADYAVGAGTAQVLLGPTDDTALCFEIPEIESPGGGSGPSGGSHPGGEVLARTGPDRSSTVWMAVIGTALVLSGSALRRAGANRRAADADTVA